MVLAEDHVVADPVSIPCFDAAFIPVSKFLVVLDSVGSLILYDGTNQVFVYAVCRDWIHTIQVIKIQ